MRALNHSGFNANAKCSSTASLRGALGSYAHPLIRYASGEILGSYDQEHRNSRIRQLATPKGKFPCHAPKQSRSKAIH